MMHPGATGLIVSAVTAAVVSGAAIPLWWHHKTAAERTHEQVMKVFEEQWPDKPFTISRPKVAVVSEPSLFDARPMMVETAPPKPIQPQPEHQSKPEEHHVQHEYCWPGRRVNYGRHWRCVYSHNRK